MMSILVAYSTRTRVHIAALLYFLTAGVLTQVPLFNYLGYEFSALMTIPTALISGILTIQFLREHRTKPLTRRTWLYVIGDYLLVNLLLLLVPLAVISLNALVVKNCSYVTGLTYYLLLPVVTMVFSVALALVVGTVVRRATIIFSLLVLAMLLHIIVITYVQPQLFAYNVILGFFPGITYDETLSDITILIVYREFTLIAALMLFIVFTILVARWGSRKTVSDNIAEIKEHFPRDKKLWGYTAVCFVIVFAGHLFRADMGFEFSASHIQKELGRRSESDHLIFYYSDRDYSIQEVQRIKAEAEFHYRHVANILLPKKLDAKHPSYRKKIDLYIYPSGEIKRRFIGTLNTNIAKPWKREIHLTTDTFESSFRHELVHILAAEFGFPVINASTRMALNEGLAVAVDWQEGLFSPHQYAAALLRDNTLNNVPALFSLSGFALQSSSYAYLVSGSFSKYLIDRFGMYRYKRAFANGNFVIAFGENLESLLAEWKAYLKLVDTSDLPSETVRALFFQQSIFYRTCPREVAEKNKRAVQAIRVKNYSAAEEQFSSSYNNAPTVYALRGIMQSLIAQRKYNEVVARFTELPENSVLRLNPSLLLFVADAYLLQEEREAALQLYQKIGAMNYTESFNEAAMVRKRLIIDGIEGEAIRTIYYEGVEDSVKSLFLQNKLLQKKELPSLQYVLAAVKERTGESFSAAMLYQNVLDSETGNDMKYFAAVRAANILYGKNEWERAKSLYWYAKNFTPTETMRDYLDERIELCDAVSIELQ